MMITGFDTGFHCTSLVTLNESGKPICKAYFGTGYTTELKSTIKEPLPKRYRLFTDHLHNYLENNKITGTVVIEESYYANLQGNAVRIVPLFGAYLVELTRYIDPYKIYLIKPTMLKKLATGSGLASKEDMIEFAKKNGFFPDNHHEADAFAMAYISYLGKFYG